MAACKRLLGGGLQAHLVSNPLLHAIFEFSPTQEQPDRLSGLEKRHYKRWGRGMPFAAISFSARGPVGSRIFSQMARKLILNPEKEITGRGGGAVVGPVFLCACPRTITRPQCCTASVPTCVCACVRG
jgi:hypothetical protein